jgi:hypothetical protein
VRLSERNTGHACSLRKIERFAGFVEKSGYEKRDIHTGGCQEIRKETI